MIKIYTMMQVCRKLDMTYQTLKCYCNEGLVPNAKTRANNRRIFDEHDVKMDQRFNMFKKCGLSIQEMKDYLERVYKENATILLRKEMLAKKREELEKSIRELEDSIDYIDWKQNFYDNVLTGKQPYISNLIRKD